MLLAALILPAASTASPHRSAKALRMVARTLVYLPEQIGGNYHDALVLVQNRSRRRAALGVGGQLSVYDAGRRLVKSANPTTVNILPGGYGLLEETFDL